MTSAMTRSGYDEMAARYDEGRALPLDRLEGWRRALAGVLSTGGSVRIVDVGSGTGLWSMAFATWFGARVVGVEPSAGMRHQAAEKRPHPRVAYVAGRGDAIPLAGDSCSAAWLSTVVHHFRDPEAAALELRRVLHPDAPVLIREGFTGRTDGIPWLGYFPEALAITEQLWPTVDDVVAAFAPAGFRFAALERVAQITARNRREYADLVPVRADSTLVQLTDHEFSAGMERLDPDAAGPSGHEPAISTLDLLVLR
jgi:ubiquinone/menaquinone biosynthesis C-methylase UbiE